MTWGERLLSHLHRVFDKTPWSALAFRVNADGTGLTWSVDSEYFRTVVTGGTGQNLAVALSGHTIATLTVYIDAQPGYSIPYLNSEVSGLAATALIEASGNVNSSNGDHVLAFTSPLWAYIKAVGYALSDAKAQIVKMLRQMITTQAEGEWADFWGGYYRVPRVLGETDAVYSARVIAEVLRPKVNAMAMEVILTQATGMPVVVYEPWKNLFIVGKSMPSQADRLHDGCFYAYETLEIRSQADNTMIRPIAQRIKAAGVKLWYRQDLLFPLLTSRALLVGMFAEVLQLPIDAGEIGYRSYNNGGTVYDERGATYVNVTVYTATHLYTILAYGAPGATIPLHAGAAWLPSFLDGLGYHAGDAVLVANEQFYTPVDEQIFDVRQAV